jgi:NADH:ubiquinone oxidoreductase subunit E
VDPPVDSVDLGRMLAALPRQRAALLPALLLAQRTHGHVSDEAMRTIAAHLRLTVNDVEGVVTGYPDLRRRPVGAHVVRVCTGLSCWAAGGADIVAALASALGITLGETTPDGALTLEETSCAFACAVVPVVEIDGVCHGRLTIEGATALVSALAEANTARDWKVNGS